MGIVQEKQQSSVREGFVNGSHFGRVPSLIFWRQFLLSCRVQELTSGTIKQLGHMLPLSTLREGGVVKVHGFIGGSLQKFPIIFMGKQLGHCMNIIDSQTGIWPCLHILDVGRFAHANKFAYWKQ